MKEWATPKRAHIPAKWQLTESEVKACKALTKACNTCRVGRITPKRVAPVSARELVEQAKQYGTLMLLMLLFAFPAISQEPTPYVEFTDTNCTQILTLDSDYAHYGYDLNEKWCSVGVDTFTGFWKFDRFFVPSKGIVLTFMDCGVSFDPVPNFGVNIATMKVYAPMPDYHWSMAAQLAGLLTTWAAANSAGHSEGLLTVQAPERIEAGLHPRSSTSHQYRDVSTVGYALGLFSLGIGCYEYERQLRIHAPRKGFWYSTDFWPTVGRNAVWITAAGLGGHFSAQWGYNSEIRNP